jgi:predicted small lipoprotein YifL
MIKRITIIIILSIFLIGCGKVGPLVLPEDSLNKSIITYPCEKECMEKFEAEKIRQQSIILQSD